MKSLAELKQVNDQMENDLKTLVPYIENKTLQIEQNQKQIETDSKQLPLLEKKFLSDREIAQDCELKMNLLTQEAESEMMLALPQIESSQKALEAIDRNVFITYVLIERRCRTCARTSSRRRQPRS